MSKNFKKRGPFSSDENKKEKGPFSFSGKSGDKKTPHSPERNFRSSDKRNELPHKKNYSEGKPEHSGSFRDRKNSDKSGFKGGEKGKSAKPDFKKPFNEKYKGKRESGTKIEVAGKGRTTGYRKKDIYEVPKQKSTFIERREKRADDRGEQSFKRDDKSSFRRNDSKKDFTEKRPFNKKQSSYSNWRDKADKAGYKKTETHKPVEAKDGDQPLFKKTFADKGQGENFKARKNTGKEANKKIPFAASREKSADIPHYNLKRPMKAKKEAKEKAADPDGLVRLNKYISNAGLCSRRDADKMIEEGLIKVNGKVVTELGYKIKPTDIVQHSNNTLRKERPVYVLLNKPKDFITTTDDPGERKTVMDLVANACKERIYPVGRLDRNTSGLLLLTNDGELAAKLTHPSNGIKKLYQADLDKPLEKEDFEKILNGLELEDGVVHVDDLAVVSPDAKSIGIEIHEGRNRIVRRIFEHLGYDVVKLDRVVYAGLTKKDLPRGNWRHLTEKEVVQLKFFI
jgi:23S rRNA pseudouridine2605 synthase